MAAKTSMSELQQVVWFWAVVAAAAAMVCSSMTQVEASGWRVGGRTEIKGVKGNEEVQELGRYCVDEYNSIMMGSNGGDGLLSFSEVLEAERQVVAGVKYYLKISAVSASTGVPYTFDAELVVKPWLHSKHLLSFAPSSHLLPPSKPASLLHPNVF